jgi:hypothetical protein
VGIGRDEVDERSRRVMSMASTRSAEHEAAVGLGMRRGPHALDVEVEG